MTVVNVNRDPVVTVTEQATGTPRCGTSLPLQCLIPEGYNDPTGLVLNVTVSDDPGEDILALTMTPSSTDILPGVFTAAAGNRSATLVIQPGFTAAGTYDYTIHATDSSGATTTAKVLLTVTNVNRPPVMRLTEILPPNETAKCSGDATSGSWSCTINENYPLELSVVVTDPDTDDSIILLTMSASRTMTGASFSAAAGNGSGTFVWIPDFTRGNDSTSNTTTFSFTAQDSFAQSLTRAVTVTVKDVNRPPTVSLQSGTVGSVNVCRNNVCFADYDTSTNRGETLVLKLTVSDPDGDSPLQVLYFSKDLPQIGPVFDPQNRIFAFTVQSATTEDFVVGFRARDPGGQESTLYITIRTNAADKKPTLTRLRGTCPEMVLAGQSVLCSVFVDDEDPRDTRLNITSSFINGGSFSYDATTRVGTFIMVPPLTAQGHFQVDFTATDTKGNQAKDSYVFFVQRSSVMEPIDFPVFGGPVKDMAYHLGRPGAPALAHRLARFPRERDGQRAHLLFQRARPPPRSMDGYERGVRGPALPGLGRRTPWT